MYRMAWPDFVREHFEIVPANSTDESEYYGPYNAILNYLFPITKHYQIAPQYKGPVFPGSVDYTTLFIVLRRKHLVFFIEMKAPNHIDTISKRATADSQMRDRFRALEASLVIPKLYALSALGTRLCIYNFDKQTRRTQPSLIPRDPEVMNDEAPAARWDTELLSAEGEAKLRDLAARIEGMCSQLQ
jgi:hypothetical protein